jgi:Uma2 family endonuclease
VRLAYPAASAQRQPEAHPRAVRRAVLELAADGSLIPMTPTGSETGARNANLLFQIQAWTRAAGGWKVFDSSTGFRLPDNSVLSPDVSLVELDRWQALSEAERRGFAPLCPDLVVELASSSDDGPRGITALRQKMAAYQRNGARLGWLLIPAERTAEVWGPLADGKQSWRKSGRGEGGAGGVVSAARASGCRWSARGPWRCRRRSVRRARRE